MSQTPCNSSSARRIIHSLNQLEMQSMLAMKRIITITIIIIMWFDYVNEPTVSVHKT